jgi:hypothetical protein
MNVGTFNGNFPQNTIPPWLLPCDCGNLKCHYIAQFKPDILYVQGLSY